MASPFNSTLCPSPPRRPGYYLTCYIRNLVGAVILYFIMGAASTYIVRYSDQILGMAPFKDARVKKEGFERDQMSLALTSVLMYAMLPVLDEWLIESGYTKAYMSVADVGGWLNYGFYTILYLMLVEVGIYWMHRQLHSVPLFFKYIHAKHHLYNSPDTLSPWASIAFNPIDGILQACPYTIVMLFVPVHYITHFIMLFLTAVWATNIHDCLVGNTEPVMGSKYHTVHHTHYNCNYGQYFVFCDWIWGTLRQPDKGQLEKPKTS